MEQVHVKNLEKYLPGFTDRTFAWLKLYFRDTKDPETKIKRTGIFNDTEFMALDEIDRYRFISLACMQGFLGKSVPLHARNLAWMGWNLKKRSKSKTLLMLHSFVDVSPVDVTQSRVDIRVEKSRVEESREEKKKFLDFVFLTENEYKKLVQKYGEKNTQRLINNLNTYIGSHGKKYKSHYYTLLKFANTDGLKPLPQAKNGKKAELTPQKKQEIHQEFAKYYQEMTVEQLKAILSGPTDMRKHEHGWLISDVIKEKEQK